MMAMASFATLLMATLAATSIAILLDWLMLRVAFRLMEPARKRAVVWGGRPDLVRGTVQLVRAFGAHR